MCLAHQIHIEDTIIVDLVEPHFKVTRYYLGYYRVFRWFFNENMHEIPLVYSNQQNKLASNGRKLDMHRMDKVNKVLKKI